MLNIEKTLANLKGITNEEDIHFAIQEAFDTTEIDVLVDYRSELKNAQFPQAEGYIAYEDYETAPEFYVYAEENEDGEYSVVDVQVIER